MNTNGFARNRSIMMLGLGLVIGLLILGWTQQSSQKLLRNTALLVDKVMQLRVDLSQAHYLIHEQTENSQASLDRDYVMSLVTKINESAVFLNGEHIQMGRVSGQLNDHHILPASINRLKTSLNDLSNYLEKNYATLNRDVQEDMVHDGLFFNAEMMAEEIDEQVHEGVALSLERQRNVFRVLFGLSFLAFSCLLLLLKQSNKRQAMALEQSMKLTQALACSGEAAIVASTDGIIEFVNDAFCQMTGYSAEEAVGNNPSMISSGKQNKAFYENLWSTVSSGRVWKGELTNRKKDGSLYQALMTIAPIFDQAGSITHYVANQRDMSEYKALEAQVFQAQKTEALGTLAGGIAHDFNNALAGIIGNAYLLNKVPDDQEKVIKHALAIQGICDKAAIHIKQVLSYARNDTVLMNSVELNQCVQSACQMASSMIPATIELQFISNGEEMYVHWNETQVQQILINLINNARHALKGIESPRITLEISILDNDEKLMRGNHDMTDEKYICLSVKDNGCGMPKNIMERIFDPFFTTKDAEEGTGLGLSMAYGAVKQAGGYLSVDSAVGRGSEFSICLPIDFETTVETVAEDAKTHAGHGETILVADDDLQLLQVQKDIIESFGYNVLVAEDGLKAVAAFEKHANEICVVILDLVMPGLTGMKAAVKILTIRPDTKIILLTGYDRESALDGDVNIIDAPVIYKPYKAAAISQLIHEQINKKVMRFNS